MQVSKWLGQSTFVLALTTYAGSINEDEMAAQTWAAVWSTRLPTS